ncbi:hypothetical protein SKAU_G00380830 [Synaphobranchus kaupii]|uniref:Uncharacterized protein n=1 Tax=Synaphobranchus kaupii TaxID=118154 RepID=A0A9Q1EDL3_SYNKA|nr:hypothetical protein SKAU_G00380830 [Synaphobranchus kaupii]
MMDGDGDGEARQGHRGRREEPGAANEKAAFRVTDPCRKVIESRAARLRAARDTAAEGRRIMTNFFLPGPGSDRT